MSSKFYQEMWDTIKSGKIWQGEVLNQNKYGEPYWNFPIISPEYDNQNNLEGYIAIRYDITSKKELEEKHQKLMQAEKLKSMGEMIGNIAHQWRQPLSVISTASTGMKIKKEFGVLKDEDILTNCDAINDNAQYLSQTIDDFRNFIKGDRNRTVFNLQNTINNFLHLVEGIIKTNYINIILDLQEDLKIDGYENELLQCLVNIFNNAKDVLTEKELKNKFIFITTLQKKDKIIIKIKDNAGGIPNSVLPKIFDPYFTTKHKSNGTGLGLHMSYKIIVEGMGGTIEAHNVKYKYENIDYTGAEFIITL